MVRGTPIASRQLGKEEFFKSRAWRELRFRVLKKYGFSCMACGRSRQKHKVVLHVDHIKPRSRYPELEMEEDNKTFELQLKDMGIEPSWGNAYFNEGPDYVKWTESYIKPKDAFGVLFTLAHVIPKHPRQEGEVPKFPD